MAQKGKNAGAKELRKALGRSGGALAAVALFSAAINLLMLTGPLFMLQVYDRVLGSGSSSTLFVLFGIVVFLFLTMGILDHVRGRVLARIGARLQQGLDRRVLSASLIEAENPDARKRPAAALAALNHLQAPFLSPSLGAVLDLPWTPLFLAILFMFNIWMGWFAVGAALIVAILAILNQMATRKTQGDSQRFAGEADMRGAVMRREIDTLRGLGMRKELSERWKTARDSALGSQMAASDRGGAFTTGTKAFRMLVQSAMLALGAWLVLQEQLTAGAMIAGSILLGRALAPVEQTVGQWAVLQRAWIAKSRLNELLSMVPETDPPMELPRPEPKLELQDVIVVPPGAKAPTLQRATFTALPGDAIAVIGPSASGKSTLARAMVGLWPIARGEIRLGGAKIDQYDPDRLGKLMGYLPQDVMLFAGTVAENIARFQPDANPESTVAAARLAAAHDLILSLPNGYDTQLSDGGSELSGGQRQRIGLARAFFGDPVVLVLDEPNAALDDVGVRALNTAISNARKVGKLVFVMSHRPSALAECNKVLLIESGAPRAFGPRDEVLERLRQPANVVAAARGKAGAV
ncbi:protease/lipase ABC transporter permease/ATP-binding protein [Thioclava sp. SK-1]|uniref:type I secretion system permease/ATPase n=1 Tax=Thioclava sp. SK-1 TaxID=1889770 RepID=UPI000824FA40|nr:type I secretion system permease/ATPase [Thioclava sp. SK-1]OCX65355.1 protease/lipase ABC transporter permease/ATP-binding protein [Thioclava sp. SK-1]